MDGDAMVPLGRRRVVGAGGKGRIHDDVDGIPASSRLSVGKVMQNQRSFGGVFRKVGSDMWGQEFVPRSQIGPRSRSFRIGGPKCAFLTTKVRAEITQLPCASQLRRRSPHGPRRRCRRDAPARGACVRRAAAGTGGVRGVAGCPPRGALYRRRLPRLLRRRRLCGRRWFPVRPRDLPLLSNPGLPASPELTRPCCLGQAPLLRRRFARRVVHRHHSGPKRSSRENADVVCSSLAVQSLHIHHWYKRKLRTNSLRSHALDSHMFDEGCRVLQAAFWYGLIVHFRIYPIIYAIPFVIVLGKDYTGFVGRPTLTMWRSKQQLQNDKVSQTEEPTTFLATVWGFLSNLISRNAILFGLLSGSMFFVWTGVFFYLYGWDFLNEALLYHLTRTDPRHNFSIYFYHIYLHHQQGFSSIQRLASFLPQLIVQLALILRFSRDLPFCMFLQTVAFVAFNKVMTAQYFVWFFCLLPLILPWSSMKLKCKGLACTVVWMGSQLHWLMWAYLLEFKGRNVFVQLWVAGLMFLAANTFVMLMVMKHQKYTPLFSSPVKSGNKVATKKEE